MIAQPVLLTPRLVLRPFVADDAPAFYRLAGDRRVADTMLSIPHPLDRQRVDRWIVAFMGRSEQGEAVTYAVTRADDAAFMGAVALRDIDTEHLQAELSFWIGVPYWGCGYASEAGRRLVRSGFEEHGLNRIYAHHMVRNPASGRVLEKVGMQQEGVLRQRVRKWGVFEDVVLQAVLRADFGVDRS